MTVKDVRSNLRQLIANAVAVSGDGVTNGAAIDTQESQSGIMFSMAITNFTDGSYDVIIEEDDDSAFSDPSLLGDNRLIGTIAGMTLDAESANDDVVPTIGVVGGAKRYLRCNVVASGVTTGAFVTVIATLGIDHMPSAEADAAAS